MRVWWVTVAVLAGCYGDTPGVICGELRCPVGRVCSPSGDTCVTHAQVDGCAGRDDGISCAYPGTPDGVCHGALCIAAGCGNGIIEPGEVCDDGNRLSVDGCRADCASREECGDGYIDIAFGEECDCGSAGAVATRCEGSNSSDSGAECRTDCQLSRCGDGILDPDELCDDGNKISLDGCRADCASREECGDGNVDAGRGEDCDCGKAGAVAANCSAPNSDAPGAECRLDCQPARCGDGVLDPQELCDDGNTLYFDGCRGDCRGRFAKMQTPTAQQLWGVYTNGTEAWAVGDAGTLLYYDGTTWVSETVGLSAPFTAVWASARNNVYIASSNGSVMRFNGTTYQSVVAGPSIWGSAANDVWAMGNGAYRFDGTSWTLVNATSPCNQNMTAVSGRSATEVYWTSNTGLCRYNGAASVIANGPLHNNLTVGGTQIYSLSSTSTASALYQWTGTPRQIAVPGLINAIAATATDEVLGIGTNGTILSYDGETWLNLESPTELPLSAISATTSQNVFITGVNGTILH